MFILVFCICYFNPQVNFDLIQQALTQNKMIEFNVNEAY